MSDLPNVSRKPYGKKVLRLNADMQPISYFPLSCFTWQQVAFLMAKEQIQGRPILTPVAYYDDVVIRTPSKEFRLPSVVAHAEFIPLPDDVPFTKFNIMLRDNFTCQYTGKVFPPGEINNLTFDHIMPQSRGGKTSWDNIVCCDAAVNRKKDNRTPREAGLTLKREPHKPSVYELRERGRKYPPNYLHETWEDFLYWDVPLES